MISCDTIIFFRFKGAVVVKISPAFRLLKFGLFLRGAFQLMLHIGFLCVYLLRKLCDLFFAFSNKAVQQVNIQAAFAANDVDRLSFIVGKLLLLFLQPHGRHSVAASGKRCGFFVLLGDQTILGRNTDSGELVAHQSVYDSIELCHAIAGLSVTEVRMACLEMTLITAFDLIAHRSIFADILLAGGRQRQPVFAMSAEDVPYQQRTAAQIQRRIRMVCCPFFH
ncbi:MAG: hypothetical protein V8T00_07730 [Oscillospiraceae bacterium]